MIRALYSLLLLSSFLLAQEKPAAKSQAVTVPATIDHNRIVVDGEIPLPDGSMQRVHVWVDNGNPDLNLSRQLAMLLNLAVTCGEHECSSPPPKELVIGGMTLPLTESREAKIPLKPVSAAAVMAPGMNAEISLPARILRHYDVLVDFPGHKFTLGPPGSIHFLGSSSKVEINVENGLIQVPSQIENKKYNLALDLGAPISFLSDELFDRLGAAHPDWPRMTGAVGSANMWGLADELNWKLMRIDRVQYGPLFLTDVPFVDFPKERMEFFNKRAGIPTAGLLGADALQNYRVGLDYAHATVHFDIGRLFNFPEFDVIGLVLRPEDDGNYSILGVADFDGKPSVPSEPQGVKPGDQLVAVNDIPVHGQSMGQVWALLGGTPGQERKLTIARAGKQFTIAAKVQHFLAVSEDDESKKKKKH